MIKKILLLLMAMMVFLPSSLSAQDFEYKGITYTVIDEAAKTCMTKSGDSSMPGNVVVTDHLFFPDHIMNGEKEFTLVKIGDYGFSDRGAFKHITIPSSVTSIGDNAFKNCTKLTSVEIPCMVNSIEAYTFVQCI